MQCDSDMLMCSRSHTLQTFPHSTVHGPYPVNVQCAVRSHTPNISTARHMARVLIMCSVQCAVGSHTPNVSTARHMALILFMCSVQCAVLGHTLQTFPHSTAHGPYPINVQCAVLGHTLQTFPQHGTWPLSC